MDGLGVFLLCVVVARVMSWWKRKGFRWFELTFEKGFGPDFSEILAGMVKEGVFGGHKSLNGSSFD